MEGHGHTVGAGRRVEGGGRVDTGWRAHHWAGERACVQGIRDNQRLGQLGDASRGRGIRVWFLRKVVMIEEYCAFASFCVYLFWLVGKLGCKVGSTPAGDEAPPSNISV